MVVFKYLIGYIISLIVAELYIEMTFPPGPGRPVEMSFFIAIILMIPAIIANNKGRSFFGWLFYGNFLWIIALVHSITLSANDKVKLNDGELKKCPYCGEFIRKEAIKCRFCQSELPEEIKEEPKNQIEIKPTTLDVAQWKNHMNK